MMDLKSNEDISFGRIVGYEEWREGASMCKDGLLCMYLPPENDWGKIGWGFFGEDYYTWDAVPVLESEED